MFQRVSQARSPYDGKTLSQPVGREDWAEAHAHDWNQPRSHLEANAVNATDSVDVTRL